MATTSDFIGADVERLVHALQSLRKPARVQAAEAELRAARQVYADAEQRLQNCLVLDRERRGGDLRLPGHDAALLSREVIGAEDMVKGARAARDAARDAALPSWLRAAGDLDGPLREALNRRFAELSVLLDAMSIAARFFSDQRQAAPPLIASAPRMAGCLQTGARMLAATVATASPRSRD